MTSVGHNGLSYGQIPRSTERISECEVEVIWFWLSQTESTRGHFNLKFTIMTQVYIPLSSLLATQLNVSFFSPRSIHSIAWNLESISTIINKFWFVGL